MTISDTIYNLFHRFGDEIYGESCTQTSHAVQGGLLAQKKRLDDEIVVAAFLHDIGHLYPLSLDESHEKMGHYGVQEHDKWGALFLREYGFAERIIVPVEKHANSKRYLCTTRPDYLAELSSASVETMKYQGGLMSDDEIKRFEQIPFFDESLQVRFLDDEGKAANFTVTDCMLRSLCDLASKHAHPA